MRSPRYRLTVLGNTVVWLLVGLHLPTTHELMDHGWAAPASVRVMTAVLALVGAGLLWVLLRPAPGNAATSGRDGAA
jgi:hypothetical protein